MIKLYSKINCGLGPDSANGRAPSWEAGGRGFDPWQRHTKGVKGSPTTKASTCIRVYL